MEKCTCYFKHKTYCNIKQNLSNQFPLHSAKAHSEPYQTSKINLFSKIVNSFHALTIFAKSSMLDVWGGFWTCFCPVKHKNKKTIHCKDKTHGSFKASYISVFNHWEKLETTVTKEIHERNQMAYLQS